MRSGTLITRDRDMERIQLSDRLTPSPSPGPRVETIQLVAVEPAHGLLDMNMPFVQKAPVRRPWSFKARLFAGLVLAPTFAAAVYFFLFAAHRYVSEASFIVRSAVYQ